MRELRGDLRNIPGARPLGSWRCCGALSRPREARFRAFGLGAYNGDMDARSGQRRVLAIETSSARGSVALGEGPHLLAVSDLATTSQHCQLLMPTIDNLCMRQGWDPKTLDEIHVSAGPGSFTGLRIAVTVAKALAISLRLRVVAVPTLDVIAARAEELADPPPNLGVALDAKRKQVFGAVYRLQAGRYRPLAEACLLSPAGLLARTPQPRWLTGEGLTYHAEAFRAADTPWVPEEHRWPRAEEVHRLGWEMAAAGCYTDPERLLPIYVRIPEAEERWSLRHGGMSHRKRPSRP
ncbi:MAG: tRNA (adenosine(37)-N6)-threonylcarbamoyltransferase complex dimerization subunit type 1 TsaB [Phycisphaerales bacterium]|nr:MAG: tRNA (adenosine(37)-N6)-threonylcarbamoyltransferase complex dimerization subunit type 1 TsaB [Phycisphaerales bacterium]